MKITAENVGKLLEYSNLARYQNFILMNLRGQSCQSETQKSSNNYDRDKRKDDSFKLY